MMAMVTSLRVKEGDRVRAGQLLLTLDDSDVVQKVKAAEEGFREARNAVEAAKEQKNLVDVTYRRYKNIYDQKALTGQELDQIKTRQKVAESELDRAGAAAARAEAGVLEARAYGSFTRITSPVNGYVTGKSIEVGNMAAPGMPLLTIEDSSSYRIEAGVDEGLAEKIHPGMNASVYIGSLDREMTAKVTEVVPSVNPASRTFLVKIGLAGQGLRNGFYGKVSLPVGMKSALLVPGNSVVDKGELTGVYTVDRDSVVRYRLVRVGKTYGGKVEILSGINPGDRVVVGGVEKAVDGGIFTESKK
jgi:RND family efflux transporter MFP subunit